MPVSRRIRLALCSVLFALLLAGALRLATPITVHLRVEGARARRCSKVTVTTQPETFETASSKGPHPCDYKENGPAGREVFEDGGNESATPTTALRDAALESGLAFNAKWFGSGKEGTGNPGDFFVTQVGSDVELTEAPISMPGATRSTTRPRWSAAVRSRSRPATKCCGRTTTSTSKHLLSLSGPASVERRHTVHGSRDRWSDRCTDFRRGDRRSRRGSDNHDSIAVR